jgi:hypothetical protein
MVSICFGLKEEELWEVHTLHLAKIKRELFSQGLLIKENFLCVIGQQDLQTRLVVKMTPLLAIGINRDAIDLLLLLTYYLPMSL